jgi:dTDP-4-dehydrorhamnose reductase
LWLKYTLFVAQKQGILSFISMRFELQITKVLQKIISDSTSSRGSSPHCSCKSQNATFIQISTDFIFDGKSSIPYLENDLPSPISVYGKTKKEGEDEIMKSLTKYYILRTSWLYSEYGHNFLKTMLKIGAEKSELNVIFDQIGTPTYAKDLARVILKLIRKPKPIDFGIYNFSNEGVASWYDFASAIFEYSKMKTKVNPIRTEMYPTPAIRPYFSVLDKNKIKHSLNIKIPHWRESLKICLKNLKDQTQKTI